MTEQAGTWDRARKNLPIVLTLLVVSIGMIKLGEWSSAREHAATPRILSGRAGPLTSGNRLACCSKDKLAFGGQEFSVASVRWRDVSKGDPTWHREGVPACLSRTEPNVVRMGVVTIRNRGGGPAIDVAGWVECR